MTIHGRALVGRNIVTVTGKELHRSIPEFAAAMSMRNAFSDLLEQPQSFLNFEMYHAVFDDDVYLLMSGKHTSRAIMKIMAFALAAPQPPGLIYLHSILPEAKTPLNIYGEFSAPSFDDAPIPAPIDVDVRLVQSKSAYGAHAFLINNQAAWAVRKYWDPESPVFTAEGALRKAVIAGDLKAAHCIDSKGKKFDILGSRDDTLSRMSQSG